MEQRDTARELAQKIIENIEKVIVGKSGAVELGVIALMCEGHALIEDVPGVGKTMLARSIARFRRARASSESSSRPTFCPRTSPASPYTTSRRASSSSGKAPSSRRWFWRTR